VLHFDKTRTIGFGYLKEYLKKGVSVLKFIENLCRYEANTKQEFLDLIMSEGCPGILVMPFIINKGPIDNAASPISRFEYILEFSFRATRGKKAVYRQFCFQRNDRLDELGDEAGRADAGAKIILLGEREVEELRGKLPGTVISYMSSSGLIDDDVLGWVHRHAAENGVAV